MEASHVRRAVEAAQSTARALGLPVDDAVVIHNSDRIAVRLIPCDVLARIAPHTWEDGLQFEAEVARRLAETDSPVGALEPRAEPRVYLRDTFALTLWTYYEQVGALAPADYADALIRIYAGLRQIDLAAPHITDRVAAWAEEVDNRAQTPELPGPDRALLSNTFHRVRNVMSRWDTGDQLLHGEPQRRRSGRDGRPASHPASHQGGPMASRPNARIAADVLSADRQIVITIKNLPDFAPRNLAYNVDSLEQRVAALTMAEEAELLAQQALEMARERAIEAGLMLHSAVQGAKVELLGQYGEDSPAVYAIGRKKKSERRRPTRRTTRDEALPEA